MANMFSIQNGFTPKSGGKRPSKNDDLKYCDYLKLDTLLSAQSMRSVEFNQPAHHEHLFIITHQVYELWFKQIIFELDSCKNEFKGNKNEIENSCEVVKRLNRIVQILKLLIEQLAILETMTPSDFMEFRQFLTPASGFQSLQFRLIENKLGLMEEHRVVFQKGYLQQFLSNGKAYSLLEESQKETSLFCLIEMWLEQWPRQAVNVPQFIDLYKASVEKFLEETAMGSCTSNGSVTYDVKKRKLVYESLFNPDIYQSLFQQSRRHFSYKAHLGAVIITLYNQEPFFSTPYQIINLIIDVDSYLVKWRHSHLLMVQKMIGSSNMGTGGSSGCQYLKSTLSDQYSIFADLANISAFIIPRKFIPPFSLIRAE